MDDKDDELAKVLKQLAEQEKKEKSYYENSQNYDSDADNKDGNIGFGILGFFIPIVGFVLWLVWENEKPKNARYSGLGALFGFILYVLLVAAYFFTSSQIIQTLIQSLMG